MFTSFSMSSSTRFEKRDDDELNPHKQAMSPLMFEQLMLQQSRRGESSDMVRWLEKVRELVDLLIRGTLKGEQAKHNSKNKKTMKKLQERVRKMLKKVEYMTGSGLGRLGHHMTPAELEEMFKPILQELKEAVQELDPGKVEKAIRGDLDFGSLERAISDWNKLSLSEPQDKKYQELNEQFETILEIVQTGVSSMQGLHTLYT